jgi:hypothetical protein
MDTRFGSTPSPMNSQPITYIASKDRAARGFKAGLGLALFSLLASTAAADATLTPNSVDTGSTTPVVLLLTDLTPGESVIVERYIDANANGAVDGGEFLAEKFSATDGQVTSIGGVRNLNVPGDDDLTANGQISVKLNPAYGPELGRLAGAHLIRLSSPTAAFTPFTLPLTITQPAQAQSISGTVTDGTNPVPHASVVLLDANSDGHFVLGTVANATGQFTLNAPVGSYVVAALKTGYVTNFESSPAVALGAGQTPTHNPLVAAATTSISGTVADADTSAGLGGVQLFVESEAGLVSVASSNANGTYSVPVTADQWQIEVSDISLSSLGYLNVNNSDIVADTSVAAATGVNLNLSKATALIYGTVKDSSNNLLPGVEAVASAQGNLYGQGRSFAPNAAFTVAVLAGTWSLSVPEDTFPPGYTSGTNPSVTLTAGQAVQADLILSAITAHLRGQARDDSGAPLANMTLVVQKYPFIHDGAGSLYPTTDANGYFDVGVSAATWNIALECVEANERHLVNQGGYDYVVVDGVDHNGLVVFFQRSTGTITGTVKDTLNNPIPGVQLDAGIPGTGIPYYYSGCVTTDANGAYTIRVLNNTSWNVSVRSSDLNAHGFSAVSGQNVVIAGGNGVANFVASPLIPDTPPRPATFDAAGYLAHNGDVAGVIGDVPDKLDQAWIHYYRYGIFEARTDGDFNVQAYLAQYPNLAALYGSDLRAAALHWYTIGRQQGLRIPNEFDVAGYFARNADIASYFGADKYGAWLHYFNYGLFESRSFDANFIPAEYLELNLDLKAALGTDLQGAVMHWLTYGHPIEDRMGRVPIGFNVDSYLARYPDLLAYFSSVTPLAVRNVAVWNHYVSYGTLEGRSDGDFEAYNYLATNADLAVVFGTDIRAAALHWYFYGRREGRRIPANFAVHGYRTLYPDIVVVLGDDLYGSWLHYRDAGVYEGRVYDDLFRVDEYLALNPDVAAIIGTDRRDALLHWLFYGKAEGRQGRL